MAALSKLEFPSPAVVPGVVSVPSSILAPMTWMPRSPPFDSVVGSWVLVLLALAHCFRLSPICLVQNLRQRRR